MQGCPEGSSQAIRAKRHQTLRTPSLHEYVVCKLKKLPLYNGHFNHSPTSLFGLCFWPKPIFTVCELEVHLTSFLSRVRIPIAAPGTQKNYGNVRMHGTSRKHNHIINFITISDIVWFATSKTAMMRYTLFPRGQPSQTHVRLHAWYFLTHFFYMQVKFRLCQSACEFKLLAKSKSVPAFSSLNAPQNPHVKT